MKIAFLLTQSLESPSGLGRYGPLARELARLGHRVSVYALHPDIASLPHRQFESAGVRIQYVAPMHVKKQGNLKRYYPTSRLLPLVTLATWQLGRAALSAPADLIHIGKPHPMNSLSGLAARFLRGRRVFLDCDDYEAGSGNFGTGWQKEIVRFFEDHIPRHVDCLTTNTHFTEGRLRTLGIAREKIFYLPNGVDLARFPPPPPEQVEALRAELNLSGKQVVAFIGSLSLSSHPVDLLLEAFAQVLPACPNAALALVGGGEDLEPLKQQAGTLGLSQAVRFCGRVPPQEVVKYYALAHVSVDPVYDNDAARGRSPLKLFESWACGTPFVTADVGDRREILGDPPAGLLVEPGSPAALARGIQQILSEPQLAAALQQRGRSAVEAYTWDRLAGQLEHFYAEQLAHA
jgi:glycosyltransferase involved in cell wall biosynthesis